MGLARAYPFDNASYKISRRHHPMEQEQSSITSKLLKKTKRPTNTLMHLGILLFSSLRERKISMELVIRLE